MCFFFGFFPFSVSFFPFIIMISGSLLCFSIHFFLFLFLFCLGFAWVWFGRLVGWELYIYRSVLSMDFLCV